MGMDELRVDATRQTRTGTGIYARAIFPDGTYGSVDVAYLDRDSLFKWLRFRGGENHWAENTVALLLGHNMKGADEWE